VPYAGALRAALERPYPSLLDALWKSPDPDEALNQFERFLSAAGPRAGYIDLLADNARLLEGLVRLCAGGDLLTQLLITQPELLASLADPAALARRRTRAGLRAALAAVFGPGVPAAERRDRLRRVKQAEELTTVWRYLLGVTTIERYAREMTVLAEATLGFLGIGVRPPTATWGVMTNEGFQVFSTSPWPVLLPAFCIGIVSLYSSSSHPIWRCTCHIG